MRSKRPIEDLTVSLKTRRGFRLDVSIHDGCPPLVYLEGAGISGMIGFDDLLRVYGLVHRHVSGKGRTESNGSNESTEQLS